MKAIFQKNGAGQTKQKNVYLALYKIQFKMDEGPQHKSDILNPIEEKIYILELYWYKEGLSEKNPLSAGIKANSY